jgi:murein L,D-transpeptidase YcbB/YkuD
MELEGRFMNLPLRRSIIAAAVTVAAVGAGVNIAYQPAAERARTAGDGTERREADPGLELVLNIAGNRLHVYENGERTRTYKVSVGKPGHETPAGEYRISQAIWNPWWHPPDSEWARGKKPEPPGPNNPMGRVKLHFAPLLYIHGTQERAALGSPASHGCVRMRNEDVIELARLVHHYGSPDVSSEQLDQLEASTKQTRTIRLQQPIRVTARYEVAAVDDGFLVIYPDAYGLLRDQVRDEVAAVLEEHGVDARRVHGPTLERLLEKSGDRRVAIALDDLLSGSAGVGPDRREDGR